LIVLGAASGAGGRRESPSLAEQQSRGTTLVFISNRDGDNDVYAADPTRRRVAALTRNRVPEHDTFMAKNGRWLAVLRNYTDLRLVSGDGRSERSLGEGDPGPFSPNSRLFAFSRENFRTEVERQFVMSLPRGRPRALGEGVPIEFSPDGRRLAFASGFPRRLGIVDLRTGRRAVVPRAEIREFLGWTPDGKFVALWATEPDRLLVVNTRRAPLRAVVVLRANLLSAEWLTPTTLAYLHDLEPSDGEEVGTVSVQGRRRTIARGQIWSMEATPKQGGRLAYVNRLADGTTDLILIRANGSGKRVAYRGRDVNGLSIGWSPSGRLLGLSEYRASDEARRLFTVSADGRQLRPLARGRFFVDRWTWSPDERHLVLEVEGGLGVVSLPSGRVRRVWTGPSQSRQWIARALPRTAPTAAPAPRSEIPAGRTLRSRGVVYELAADGARVAALVGPAHADCNHLVAWTAGTTKTVRFSHPEPCTAEAEPYDFNLGLSGTAITWRRFYCGSYCYVAGCSADVRRPFRGSCGDGDEVDRRPPRPPSADTTRAGVSITTRNGTIRLQRVSDGRVRTIRPSGGAVDTELEDVGLFYAFNLRSAPMHGRIVFVPAASIFG
jgi:hypothetical protein